MGKRIGGGGGRGGGGGGGEGGEGGPRVGVLNDLKGGREERRTR